MGPDRSPQDLRTGPDVTRMTSTGTTAPSLPSERSLERPQQDGHHSEPVNHPRSLQHVSSPLSGSRGASSAPRRPMPGPEIDSVSSLSSEEDGSGPASPVTQQPGSFYLIEPALLDGVVDGDLSTLFRNEEEEDDNHDNHDNDDVDDTDDNDYDYVSDFDDDSSDEDNAAVRPDSRQESPHVPRETVSNSSSELFAERNTQMTADYLLWQGLLSDSNGGGGNHHESIENRFEPRANSPTTTITRTRAPDDPHQSGPRECIICCVAKDPEEFPSSPVTKACTHSPRTCFECIETSILADFMSNYWTDIRCPECRELLEQADIDLYADEDTRERYTRLAENAALSQSPNFVLCTYPGCNTGQIHGPGGAAPIVTCTMCDHRMCFRHRSDWHEGFTCEQWDQRREQLKRQMEERQSEWLLATLCKACPGCGWAIEKDQGCSHMTCLSCKYEFCWDCLSPWRRHTVFCGVMMVD